MIKFRQIKLCQHVSDRCTQAVSACSLRSINGCTQLTLLTSTGLDKIFEDMSQTSGTPFVSGTKSNSTPKNITKKHHCLVVINDYQVIAKAKVV